MFDPNIRFIDLYAWDEIIIKSMISYAENYGEEKLEKLMDKIESSTKINNILNISRNRKEAPSALDYVHTLHTIPYFIFSKNETVTMGALLAFGYWNKAVNSELNLLNPNELTHVVRRIIIEINE